MCDVAMTKRAKATNRKRPIGTLWRWPLRLTPKHHESGRGFLVRFAAQYHCTPDQVVRALGGVSRGNEFLVPSEVERLSIVAGLTEAQARMLFIYHPVRHHRDRKSTRLNSSH